MATRRFFHAELVFFDRRPNVLRRECFQKRHSPYALARNSFGSIQRKKSASARPPKRFGILFARAGYTLNMVSKWT